MEQLLITIKERADVIWPVVIEERSDEYRLPVTTEGSLEIDLTELQAQIIPYEYGLSLGRAIFATAGLRDAFARAHRASRSCLRLLLAVEASDLADIHWERLCVPVGDDHWVVAAIDQRFFFSRYLPSPIDRHFQPFGPHQLRVLLLVASPPDLGRYRLQPFAVAPVIAGLRQAIGSAHCEILADIAASSGPPTLDALCEHLAQRFYPVVHVVCHGGFRSDGEPTLYLSSHEGKTDPVSASRLIERLEQVGGRRRMPHLLFLMSCESAAADIDKTLGGLAQRLVGNLGIPAVVAMTERVSQATAQILAEGFYPRLRRHGEVDRALVEARLKVAARPDATIAMLYGRLGGRPLFAQSHSPLFVAVTAIAALTLVLAILFALRAADPREVARWLADRLEWTLTAPEPALSGSLVVAIPSQPSACVNLTSVVAAVRREAGLDLTTRPENDVVIAPVAGAWAGIEVTCPPGGLITATVTLSPVSPVPIDLLQEPGRLTYASESGAQVELFVHSALFYSLGRYDKAAEWLAGLPDPSGANASDIRWLRGNIALRQEHWQEADTTYRTAAAAAADTAQRARLLGNQILNSVQGSRSELYSHNRAEQHPTCSSAGVAELHKAINAAPTLSGLQADQLRLIGMMVRFYCPVDSSIDIPLAWDEMDELGSSTGRDPLITGALAALRAQINENNWEDPVVIEEDACLALNSRASSAEMQRVLGKIYAQSGLSGKARERLAVYARQAPLAWQRREALELSLLTWYWPEGLLSPFNTPLEAWKQCGSSI